MRLSFLSDLTTILLNLIFPGSCLHCKTETDILPTGLCENCWQGLEPTGYGNWVDRIANSAGLDQAYSGWFFGEILQSVIHSFKYQDTPKFAFHLGRFLAQELDNELDITRLDMLVPIPLHPVKKRERGYNQSWWIARGLSDEWQVPVRETQIRRIRYTESQTKLTAEQRRKNVSGAFRVTGDLTGLTIGIVDDVLTTGSTLSGVAKVCREAGALTVIGITLATPKET